MAMLEWLTVHFVSLCLAVCAVVELVYLVAMAWDHVSRESARRRAWALRQSLLQRIASELRQRSP